MADVATLRLFRWGTPRASPQPPGAPGGDITVKPKVFLTPPGARATVYISLHLNQELNDIKCKSTRQNTRHMHHDILFVIIILDYSCGPRWDVTVVAERETVETHRPADSVGLDTTVTTTSRGANTTATATRSCHCIVLRTCT